MNIYLIFMTYLLIYGRPLWSRRRESTEMLKNKVAPSAKIVMSSTPNHFIYIPDEAKVIKEITAFIESLP